MDAYDGETVWIIVEAGILFQIAGGYGRSGIREFLYEIDQSLWLHKWTGAHS